MQGSRGERPALGVIGKMTSYDYDAPVSEAGDTTWKYHLIRNVTRSDVVTTERRGKKLQIAKMEILT